MRTGFAMRLLALTVGVLLLLVVPVAPARGDGKQTLLVWPQRIELRGAEAAHRIVVEGREAGRLVGDLTAKAELVSSDPKVAAVDKDGTVRSVGDGKAVLTATVGGQKATAEVEVKGAGEPTVPSFRNDVLPVLTKMGCNSGACHGAAAGKKGFKLTLRGFDPMLDYAVLTRQASARRVDRLEPARSLVLLKPTEAIPHGGGQRFEVGSLEYRTIAEWIASGTPAPRPDDPAVERLEVFPAEASLRKGDPQQVLVRAYGSDGTIRDVTRWAKFGSTEDAVAAVNDQGLAKMQGSGEAAITVWYSSKVAVARLSVPYPTQLDPELFKKAERRNFIDDIVLRKLEALRIPPSGPASDGELIRRAYVDAAGILPTADEVEKFLADKSADKRAKLIDAILERPEFVDYWTYKWSDLLLVSSGKLGTSGMWSFYSWLRDRVAANTPWDEMGREIVTASGSSGDNGAANFFVLHKDPIDLTETTSQAFLGMSITCARCHNHPLEKWTLSDYYGMANLYARVTMKDDGRPGDATVLDGDMGEINHPKTGQPMQPRPLEGQPLDLRGPANRREHLAKWLTAPENPYFARALANRVWRNFMGRGLVEAEDDLRATNPASNEELLAALAKDFVGHRFDVKHLVRTIMTSATYQRSAVTVAGNAQDEKFYSHYLVRRLAAEVLLDAYSQVAGVPTEFAGYPKGWRSLQLPDVKAASYFLDSFGRPPRVTTCSCERQQEPSITQALHLSNGNTLNDKLRASGGTVEKLVAQNVPDEEAVKQLFLSALGRHPTEEQRKQILPLLAEGAKPAAGAKDPAAATREARRAVLEDLYWAALTGKEFLFNH